MREIKMSTDLVLARRNLPMVIGAAVEPAPEVLEGEIVEDRCELGSRGCTDSDLEAVYDPYASDVDNELVLITACPNCLAARSEEI